jgi:hypothetical protein
VLQTIRNIPINDALKLDVNRIFESNCCVALASGQRRFWWKRAEELERKRGFLVKICIAIKKLLAFLPGQVRERLSKIVQFEISDQALVGKLVRPTPSVNN